MTENSFYVAAKNLVNKKLKCERSPGLYRVFENDTYETWRPAHSKDFESKKHYGRIVGKNMHLYYILGMDENEAHLQDMIDKKVIRNTTRLSCDIAKIPLKTLRFLDDKDKIGSEKQSQIAKVRKEGKRTNEDDIAKTLAKKTKSDSSGIKGKTDCDQEKQADGNVREAKNDDGLDDMSEDDFLDGPGGTFKGSTSSENDKQSNCANKLDDGNKGQDGSIQKKSYNVVLHASEDTVKGTAACTGNCAFAQFLQGELQRAQAEIKSLQQESLNSKNAHCVAIATQAKLKLGEPIPMPEGKSLPDGHVHFGDGKTLSIDKIHNDVEVVSFDPRKRVNALLRLLFPDDVGQRTLDTERLKDSKPITSANVYAMHQQLSDMAWYPDQKPLTVEVLREYIRKESYNLRAKEKLLSLSEVEKAELLKKKEEQKRKAAERRKQKRQEKKNKDKNSKKGKKTKGSVKPIAESDSGSNAESSEGASESDSESIEEN